MSQKILAVCDYNPLIYPKINTPGRISKTIGTGTNLLACFVSLIELCQVEIHQFRDLLLPLYFVNLILLNLGNLVYIQDPELATVNIDIILELPSSPGKETFVPLLATVFLSYCFAMLQRLITSVKGVLFFSLFSSNIGSMYQHAGLKSMISLRLQWIVEEVKSKEILDLIPAFRKVKAIDAKVEKAYPLKTALSFPTLFIIFIWSLTSYWEWLGLHKSGDSWEEEHPLSAPVCSAQIFVILLLVGHASGKCSEKVDALIFETDRLIIDGGYSLKHRKKLEVMILELERYSCKVSALGLFTLDNSTATSMFGFTVNIMMILIQFIK